jgi:hypothetical protein
MDVFDSVKKGFKDLFSVKGAVLSTLFFISYLLLEVSFRAWRVSTYSPRSNAFTTRVIDASPMYLLPEGFLIEGLSQLVNGFLPYSMFLAFFLPIIPTIIGFKWFTGKQIKSVGEIVEVGFKLLLANLLVAIGVFLGSILLILPGIYLSIAMMFFPVLICSENKGLESLKESWRLSRHNELKIFALLIVLSLLVLPTLFLDLEGLGATSVYFSALTTVIGIGSITEAYKQIKDKNKDQGVEEVENEEDEKSGKELMEDAISE